MLLHLHLEKGPSLFYTYCTSDGQSSSALAIAKDIHPYLGIYKLHTAAGEPDEQAFAFSGNGRIGAANLQRNKEGQQPSPTGTSMA